MLGKTSYNPLLMYFYIKTKSRGSADDVHNCRFKFLPQPKPLAAETADRRMIYLTMTQIAGDSVPSEWPPVRLPGSPQLRDARFP